MTVKYADLEAFLRELDVKEIRKIELEEKIVRKWGASDYIVGQRTKYMMKFGMIGVSASNPNIFMIKVV
jgi:hypothetical protein